MIIKVLKIREQGLIYSTLQELNQAKKLAHDASSDQKHSLEKMIQLAQGLNQVFDLICNSNHSMIQLQQMIIHLNNLTSISPKNNKPS